MENLINFIDLNRYDLPSIIKEFSYKNYVEIGIQNGNFTEFILENTNLEHVIGVDPYEQLTGNQCGWGDHGKEIRINYCSKDAREKCLQKLSKFGNRFQFIHKSSKEYGLSIPDNSLDIVFIDGDHSEEGVYEDLEIFYKKIRRGGLLVGHDYGGYFGDCEPVVQVKPAVDKFCIKNQIKYFVTNPKYCTAEYVKEHGKLEGVQSVFIFKK